MINFSLSLPRCGKTSPRVPFSANRMTSVLNLSGLNYQNGNPLRRELQAIKTDIEGLRKEIATLKFFRPMTATAPTPTATAVPTVSPTLLADIAALKNEIATMKASGYGRGEKGEKGDKGDKGDPGQMAYIAMPPNMMMPPMAANVVSVDAAVAPAPAPAPAPAVAIAATSSTTA